MESFWHVLLWITLRHCDHRINGMKLADTLGSLFDWRNWASIQRWIQTRHIEVAITHHADKTCHQQSSSLQFLSIRLKFFAIRYPIDEVQDGILEVQKNLQRKSSALDKEDLLKAELLQRIAHIDNEQLQVKICVFLEELAPNAGRCRGWTAQTKAFSGCNRCGRQLNWNILSFGRSS